MDAQSHWNIVYNTKAPDTVSWYRPHLDRSLELIGRCAVDKAAAIIDVGGGESTLVDDVLEQGYRTVTVLDISATAIRVAQERLGTKAQQVTWRVDDITRTELPPQQYSVWHDRAVFHFLVSPEERHRYVRQVALAVKPGGHVLVATFGSQGPHQCSGLDVVRYDEGSLHEQFGTRFRLLESSTELHETPFGTTQQFLYCLCKME